MPPLNTPGSLDLLYDRVLSGCGYIRLGRRDAGGERYQHRCSPGEAEEEVPQLVHSQDQQH